MKYPTMSQAVDKDHLIELHRREIDRLRSVMMDKNRQISEYQDELQRLKTSLNRQLRKLCNDFPDP